MTASAGISRVGRAALIVAIAAALVAGCGDSGDPATITAAPAAKAACTKPVLLTELRRLGNTPQVAVNTLRCGDGYALTNVREGETRATILWQEAAGQWSQIDRVDPGRCPEQAAKQQLCKQAAPDPALRRCTDKAFLAALRDDVDKLPFRITRRRCSGNFASTTFVISDCAPEQTAPRNTCERTRIAAWRRDATRWRLITYRQRLDCSEVQAAVARFPDALCS